jgi:hypothetical protein
VFAFFADEDGVHMYVVAAVLFFDAGRTAFWTRLGCFAASSAGNGF